MSIYDSIMSSMNVGATVEEGEVNYESLFTSNNLSSSLQDVKGAMSDSSSDLQLATDKVGIVTLIQPTTDDGQPWVHPLTSGRIYFWLLAE